MGGGNPCKDPLEDFSSHLCVSSHLVDVEPSNIIPTWCNGRKRDEGITKNIDIFFILDFLVDDPFPLKSWVGSRIISYHMSILINLESN